MFSVHCVLRFFLLQRPSLRFLHFALASAPFFCCRDADHSLAFAGNAPTPICPSICLCRCPRHCLPDLRALYAPLDLVPSFSAAGAVLSVWWHQEEKRYGENRRHRPSVDLRTAMFSFRCWCIRDAFKQAFLQRRGNTSLTPSQPMGWVAVLFSNVFDLAI